MSQAFFLYFYLVSIVFSFFFFFFIENVKCNRKLFKWILLNIWVVCGSANTVELMTLIFRSPTLIMFSFIFKMHTFWYNNGQQLTPSSIELSSSLIFIRINSKIRCCACFVRFQGTRRIHFLFHWICCNDDWK